MQFCAPPVNVNNCKKTTAQPMLIPQPQICTICDAESWSAIFRNTIDNGIAEYRKSVNSVAHKKNKSHTTIAKKQQIAYNEYCSPRARENGTFAEIAWGKGSAKPRFEGGFILDLYVFETGIIQFQRTIQRTLRIAKNNALVNSRSRRNI